MATTLHIKNMVCNRCVMAVDQTLKDAGYHVTDVQLGHATLEEDLTKDQTADVRQRLQGLGFDLLEDKQEKTIEQTKRLIIQMVREQDANTAFNLSAYLSDRLGMSYSTLSKLFSKVTGITIERYYIAQRIEKVKELITYDELSLKQIALRMGYSSVAYLSGQFKLVTGMSPSQFKRLHANLRHPLDKVGNEMS